MNRVAPLQGAIIRMVFPLPGALPQAFMCVPFRDMDPTVKTLFIHGFLGFRRVAREVVDQFVFRNPGVSLDFFECYVRHS